MLGEAWIPKEAKTMPDSCMLVSCMPVTDIVLKTISL